MNLLIKLITTKLIKSQNTAFIDERIEKFRNQHSLKGMTVAIVKDEKLVFAKGYGFADKEDTIPAESKPALQACQCFKTHYCRRYHETG